MTWTALLAAIKREGEFDSSTDYDAMLLDIINEIAGQLVKRYELTDFLVPGHSLSLTQATSAKAMPTDFLRLKGKRIFYVATGSTHRQIIYPATLRQRADLTQSTPKFFTVAQKSLYLYPFSGIETGDTAEFDYYKKPATITTGANEISEPLDVCLKHGALARLLNMKDSKRAQIHLNEFKTAQIDLIANGTAS